MELVILVGLPGAGKTSFYRERFADTHVQVSNDLMRSRQDRRGRQLAIIDAALAEGRSVVVDNVNATVADRAALVEIGRRRGAAIAAYLIDVSVKDCVQRNRRRTGRERVPDVAVYAAAKRFEPPNEKEGFDALYRVEAVNGQFRLAAGDATHTVFLLSPASTSGARAVLLLRDSASFPLARQIRSAPGAPLGEVFSFLSSLYFRGKLTYARAFAKPPARLCGAFVITPGEGLRDPAEPVTIERLRAYDRIPVKASESRYMTPLLRDAQALSVLADARCRIVLLGSVASSRYVEPLLDVFGERLVFPPAFVGRGDMSRGGLLLRCVSEGRELEYVSLTGAVRHGPRPPRLPPKTRVQAPRRQS